MKKKEYLKYSDCVKNRSLLLEYVWVSKWKYKADMIYWLSYQNQNEYLIIHKWETTDLSSAPCFAQCIIPKEKYLMSCIHDEGYAIRTTYIYIKDRSNLSLRFRELMKYGKFVDNKTFLPNRKFWDLLFLYGMQEEQYMFYWKFSSRPYFWYFGIRLCGAKKYKFKD